jgi:hypothetical protein
VVKFNRDEAFLRTRRIDMVREKPDWLVRLISIVEAHIAQHPEASLRKLSKASGLGDNFLSQLKSEKWKEPQFSSVVAICDTLNLSIIYLVTGAEMTQNQERVLQHLARLSEEQQKAYLALLESLQPSGGRIQ